MRSKWKRSFQLTEWRASSILNAITASKILLQLLELTWGVMSLMRPFTSLTCSMCFVLSCSESEVSSRKHLLSLSYWISLNLRKLNVKVKLLDQNAQPSSLLFIQVQPLVNESKRFVPIPTGSQSSVGCPTCIENLQFLLSPLPCSLAC